MNENLPNISNINERFLKNVVIRYLKKSAILSKIFFFYCYTLHIPTHPSFYMNIKNITTGLFFTFVSTGLVVLLYSDQYYHRL